MTATRPVPSLLRAVLIGAVLLAAVATSGAGIAWATNLYILDDDITYSAVSGSSNGVWDILIGDDGDYQAVFGVTMYEDSDFPCKAQVRTRHLNNATEIYGAKIINACDSPGSAQTLEFTQTDRFVRGIAVCQKGGNGDRAEFIKGLRIYGAELDPNTGTLTDIGSKEFERPNCGEWKAAKFCPVGKVASRIEFHYTWNMLGPSFFIGAALECRSVVPKPIEV